MDQETYQQFTYLTNFGLKETMGKIQSENDLNSAIMALEKRREEDLDSLKEEFHHFSENMKPLNLIKNTIKKATESSEIKQGILKTTMNLSGALILKKILIHTAAGPAKTIIGTALIYGITNIISHNSEKVGEVKNKFLNFIQTKLKKPRKQIIDITPNPTALTYQNPEN